MASLNKVLLIGNATRDAEIRYLPSGKPVCNVSLATNRRVKKGDSYEDSPEFHRLQFFDRLAEIAGEYVKKGSQIYVEGRLKYGKYTDKNGVEQNTCDIIATELTLLGSKQQQGDSGAAPARAPARAPASAPAPKPQGGSGFEDMDDDIPF